MGLGHGYSVESVTEDGETEGNESSAVIPRVV